MELEQILLKKEEIIIGVGPDGISGPDFVMPIHPALVKLDVKIDPKLAYKLFPKAAKEWDIDFRKYIRTIKDKEGREWAKRYLPENRFKGHKQDEAEHFALRENMPKEIRHLGWECGVYTAENGFVESFSISHAFQGILSFYDHGLRDYTAYVGERSLRFSPEKFREYSCTNEMLNDHGAKMFVYGHHNTYRYPGSLFLRNWVVLWENEALKRVLGKR